MTNEQMIFNAAIKSGIFTAAEATAILSTGRRLPLHTYSEWKRLGYQVQEGERAALVLDLWRFGKNKASEDENGEETESAGEHAYMAKAHLFTAQQVKKAETRTIKTREELMAYNKMLAEQRKARRAAAVA